MCEIALMMVDRTHDDPVLDPRHFKFGDVIDVLEDGADWGKGARAESWLRIIRLCGVSVSEARLLCSSEPASSPVPSRTLRNRQFRMHMEHADPAFQAFLRDDKRRVPVFAFDEASARAWMAARARRPSVADPDQIGQTPHTIGG